MNVARLLAATALFSAPVHAQAWFDTARYFPDADTIGFSQPGGHPGDFFALGDHDGDGDLDLLLGEYGPVGYGALRVYRNDGGGDFAVLAPSPMPAGKTTLIDTPELRDLDGDGRGDLVVRHGNVGVAVLRSNGDGSFQPPLSLFLGGPVADVEVEDRDGDGTAEVLTLSASGGAYRVGWWSWNGAGFSVDTEASFPSSSFGGGSVAAFDADGDGTLDVAAKAQGEDAVRLFSMTGHGLVAGQVLFAPQLLGHDAWLAGGDLDGDGDGDLLLSWAELATVRLQPLVNTGGVLTAGSTFTGAASAGEMGYRDLFPTDWDADGDLDILSHATGETDFEDDRELFLLENDGSSSFSEAGRVLTGRSGRGAGVADLDLDGWVDFVAPGAVLFGDGALGGNHAELPFLSFSTNAYEAIDWEGDGDLDLWSDQGQILPNDGAGGFPETTLGTVFAWPQAPAGFGYDDLGAIGDLTGDGHPDMLARLNEFVGPFGVPQFREMRRLVDHGTGIFVDTGLGAPAGVPIGGGNKTLALLRDMDQDGDLDLVPGASGIFGSPGYWKNDGTGFLSQLVPLIPDAIQAVGDPDVDGDLDLVAVRYDSIAGTDEVILHRNRGGGSYGEERLVTLPAQTIFNRLAFLDLDGDGDEDLAAPEDFHNELYLFESTGSSQAPAVVLDNRYVDPTALVADDVDGDGLRDLVTASFDGGNSTVSRTIGVFRRTGPGLAYEQARRFVSRNHRGAADLDGDGDLDLFGPSRVLSRRWSPPASGQRVQVDPGFEGAGGVQPLLGASGAFRAGEAVAFHLVRGVGAAPALLLVGLGQGSFAGLPLPGMTLHVDLFAAVLPLTLGGPPGAAGQGILHIPHLVKPAEVGTPWSMQVFCFDPASPTLFSATNGLWFQYGP